MGWHGAQWGGVRTEGSCEVGGRAGGVQWVGWGWSFGGVGEGWGSGLQLPE